jgi:hypothetical protein
MENRICYFNYLSTFTCENLTSPNSMQLQVQIIALMIKIEMVRTPWCFDA